jgi:putative transposase
MSHKYKFHDPEGLYFITFTVIRWLDVFTRNIYREILINSLKFCQQNKGLNLHAYVIMTNHVHLIASSKEGFYLENILRDLKKFTSVNIINSIKSNPSESRQDWLLNAFEEEGQRNSNNVRYQFWQQDNHPVELTDNKMIDQKLDYIHNNPVVAGFVNEAESYVFSSAGDYAGIKGFIELELIE